jgi:hypothetical protein
MLRLVPLLTIQIVAFTYFRHGRVARIVLGVGFSMRQARSHLLPFSVKSLPLVVCCASESTKKMPNDSRCAQPHVCIVRKQRHSRVLNISLDDSSSTLLLGLLRFIVRVSELYEHGSPCALFQVYRTITLPTKLCRCRVNRVLMSRVRTRWYHSIYKQVPLKARGTMRAVAGKNTYLKMVDSVLLSIDISIVRVSILWN